MLTVPFRLTVPVNVELNRVCQLSCCLCWQGGSCRQTVDKEPIVRQSPQRSHLKPIC